MENALRVELRTRRSEMMVNALEAVALRLFEQRGFAVVTVDEIAAAAGISARTFYRYFATKEDVLQVAIDRRGAAMAAALEARSDTEPPFHAVRGALEEVLAVEDADLVRRWITVIHATPGVLRSVVGGIQLKSERVLADYLGARLGLPGTDLLPATLAAAVGAAMMVAHARWFFEGGDLPAAVSDSIGILERGFGDPSLWELSRGRAV